MPHQIIYNSPSPPVEIKSSSIFTYLFSDKASLDDSSAYIDAASGTRMSRFETYDLSLRVAYAVKQRGGVQSSRPTFLFSSLHRFRFSPNSLAWPPTLFGLIAAGLRPTLANISYTPRELTHQIKDSGARMIFVHPTLFSLVIKTLSLLGVTDDEARRRVVVMSYVDQDRADEKAAEIGSEWTRLSELLGQERLPSEELFVGDQVHETALLCYSSGTTGLSKGVEATHNNVVSFITAFLTYFDKADPKTDVIAGVLPFYHIALIAIIMADFVANVPEIVVPRFEPNFFAQTIEKYRISRMHLVPPILVTMSFHPAFDKYNMTSLRLLSSGAAPLGDGLVKKVLAKFAERGNTRLKLTQSYGLTETTSGTHWLRVEDSMRKPGSVGWLIPNIQARLVDEDEEDIQPGQEKRGELWVRGPNIMKGYLNNPTATKNAITPDGWFKTGDIATLDDEGYFRIVDRKKELIKYKGFQVPPAELEAMLLSRPDILDAAVIGLESMEEATELPCAYVVAERNAELLKDPKAAAAFGKEIEEWIKTKVAHHKFLRGGVFIIDIIPKSGSGKILRRKLRELAKEDTLRRAVGPRL
ncbi:hypothetical protein BS47DRAFT_1372215 [Hydnum rufescens UP504]|uniref:4-coumarate-CoA ligase n=1 Tax=Hydnum rufescens UP504 TaxID=1448309 RepID=A0A9P6AZJ7_9AGAM|nr:hypothetical protein BS47DRAFT_1372215 [Hydnum rufescens UP504]